MDRRDYIAKVQAERRRWRRFGALFTLIAWFFAIVAYLEVLSGFLFEIPPAASHYLLYTIFTKFSLGTLRSLLGSPGASWELTVLLVLYWGFHVAAFLALLLPLWFSFFSRRGVASLQGIAEAVQLREALARYDRQPTMLNRMKLRWLISSAGFYSLIVPLNYRWFKQPQFQWFAPAALPEPERAVINALAGLRDAMLTFLRSRRKLAPFSKPLSVLEDFFFEVAERTKVLDEPPDNPASQKQGDEKALLGRFAREVRPLLLEAHRLNALGRIPLVRFVWFRRIIDSHSVRYAAALSGITAAVMVIGTVLFKISPSQAFLTWFTVAFGSLTISVGVTAFSLHEERKKERRPPDAGAAP